MTEAQLLLPSLIALHAMGVRWKATRWHMQRSCMASRVSSSQRECQPRAPVDVVPS